MKNVIALTLFVIFSLQISFGQTIVVESFDITKNNTVDFHLTHASDINITTWSKDEVKILAKVILSEQSTDEGFAIKINKKGSDITVKSDLNYSKIPSFPIDLDDVDDWSEHQDLALIGQENGTWQAVSYQILYEIKVPKYLAVDLCTSKGNVEIRGVDAAIDIKTNNGFIDVARSASDKANVKLTTNLGEIFTDFDMDYTETTEKENHAPSCQATTIEAVINGGGDKVSLTSTCGNIYLRKAQ